MNHLLFGIGSPSAVAAGMVFVHYLLDPGEHQVLKQDEGEDLFLFRLPVPKE